MIIELEKLEKKGIIIEEYREFESSAFSHVFQRAIQLIQDIANENSQNKNEEKYIPQQINNLISFVGRRGTGKTSAMLSVHEMMKNYKDNDFTKGWKEYENLSFTTIDYIDASKLEKDENILELVLAGMFAKLREHDRRRDISERGGYENRELYQLFDEVYESLPREYSSSLKECQDTSPIRRLTQLSNSQTFGRQLRELVKRYLKYMDHGGNCFTSSNHFLVIAIDDLDMHFQDGLPAGAASHGMLESIHRYLMIPGIIVLLTYNYSDLSSGIENYLGTMYAIEEPLEKLRLGMEYLKKILPISTRIVMPSLRKKDYSIYPNDSVEIRMKRKEIDEILKPFSCILMKRNQETIDLSMKKFVFLLKASVADLYYDANGKKTHFAEVQTLRELVQTYVFYKELVYNKEKREVMFKRLLDDLYFRRAKEVLDRKANNLFSAYLRVTVDRRSRDIIRYIEENPRTSGFSRIVYRGGTPCSAYGYGELLYALYKSSSTGVFSKELVGCILESYTIVLSALYHRMISEKEKEQEIRREISKIIGASIAGSWSNLITPKVDVLRMNMRDESDLIYTLGKDDSGAVRASSIQFTLVDGNWEFLLPITTGELKDRLHMFEILSMFFSEVYYKLSEKEMVDGFYIEYKPGKLAREKTENISEKEDIENPRFIVKFSDGCFNIMNFVKNLFEGEIFFEKLHRNMASECEKYYKDLLYANSIRYDEGKLRESVKRFLEENSLYSKYKGWYDKEHGLSMPIYSFDMMYNIFKHQYQMHESKILPIVQCDRFYDSLKYVYEEIGELLREQDKFYFSDTEYHNEAILYKFYDAYVECPFISYIDSLQNNERLNNIFIEQFARMISAIAQIR